MISGIWQRQTDALCLNSRRKRKRKCVKAMVVAILVLLLYVVCFSYVRLSRDWCEEEHDRCCQIYRPSYHDNYGSVTTEDINDHLLYPTRYLELNYEDVKKYVTSGVKLEKFEFPLNSKVCTENNIYLLVVVPSKPSNIEERQAIRETWGSRFNKEAKLKLIFLTGLSDDVTNTELAKEQDMHFDIVQASFTDTYKNLTFKTISMLQWKKEFCPQAMFLLKIDDDVFLETNSLLSRLHALKEEKRFILGFIGIGEAPYRNVSSKWYVGFEDYPFNRFPIFVHGPSYVISSDLVEDLYNTARHKSRIHLEDVYVTGLSALVVRASHVGRCGFSVGHRDPFEWIMSDSVVTAHEYSPDNLRALWKELESWGRWLPLVKLYGTIVGY